MREKDKNEERKEMMNFHKKDALPHNTYRRQENYVRSLGNVWALENFNATRPYFSGD